MNFYRLLADLVAAVHFAYVGFVIVGMLLILVGMLLRWRWVRNFWFRAVHFLMIGVVAAQALCGVMCPLTTLETKLRVLAGQPAPEGTFVGRWVHRMMFFDAPPWVFTLCYCLFALAVVATLVLAPPNWPWRKAAVQSR